MGDAMSEKKIFKMGADAYMAGMSQNDNPFHAIQQPEEHRAWEIGYGEEYAYWEHQCGITAKY